MCAPRKEGEPWICYAFRWLADQPRAVMAFVGMSAAVGVYIDHRNFVVEKMGKALDEIVVELKHISTQQDGIGIRLEHLEREHEQARNSHENRD